MNAIILAAGMGTRLRPLTNEIPKCLVSINGVPIVERQVEYLHERGIYDITLISGYKANKLNYLKEKYGVDIVYNERYDSCNNIYSIYKVLSRFIGDTFILEGDVYMDKNVIDIECETSTYFAKYIKGFKNEWELVSDENNIIRQVIVGNGDGYVMSGISFWTEKDARFISDKLRERVQREDYVDLFWDNIPVENLESLKINLKAVDGIYEIDTVEELNALEKNL